MKKPSTKRSGLLLITLAVLLALVAIIAPTLAYYITSTKGVTSEHTPAKPSDPSFAKPGDPSFTLGEDGGAEVNNVYIWVPDYGYPVYVRSSIIITWQKPAFCICMPTSCEECGCETCAECMKSDKCSDCTSCEDCERCPLCNDDKEDDWIVYFELPKKDQHYTLSIGSDWKTAGAATKEPDDGFYYYTKPVESSGKIDPKNPVYQQIKIPLVVQCALLDNALPPEDGLTFNVEIIVQTVQAIGFTDPDAQGKEIPAWRDAWNGAYNYETIKY